MNPMTNIKNVLKLSEQELRTNSKSSWHDQYKDSAWLFLGGLPYDLTEGDIVCLFSQYGEVANINLIRDKKTGKQKGFCFLCYEDQRSTVLAVDNLNGIKVLGRTIRVDHVQEYKIPKDSDKLDDVTRKLQQEGCAPIPQIPEEYIKKERPPPTSTPPHNVKSERQNFQQSTTTDIKLPMRLPIVRTIKQEQDESTSRDVKIKKPKKEKKSKKDKKRRKRYSSASEDSSDSDASRKRRRRK